MEFDSTKNWAKVPFTRIDTFEDMSRHLKENNQQRFRSHLLKRPTIELTAEDLDEDETA